jgi:hypothetical protein
LKRASEWIECPEGTSEKWEAKEATIQVEELLKPTSNLELEREKPGVEYALGLDAYYIHVRDVLLEPNYGQPPDTKGGFHQPRFKLENRAFRVCKALFYIASDFDGTGGIAWADFLYA